MEDKLILYTMNLDGSDVFQVTNTTPVSGFNLRRNGFYLGK